MRTGYAIFDVVPEGGQLLLAPAGDTSAWHWLAQEGSDRALRCPVAYRRGRPLWRAQCDHHRAPNEAHWCGFRADVEPFLFARYSADRLQVLLALTGRVIETRLLERRLYLAERVGLVAVEAPLCAWCDKRAEVAFLDTKPTLCPHALCYRCAREGGFEQRGQLASLEELAHRYGAILVPNGTLATYHASGGRMPSEVVRAVRRWER